MMKRKRIYIIGDLFMKVAYFKKALVNRIGDDHLIKTLQLNWPDEYIVQDYNNEGLNGLREYVGDPDEIMEFLDEPQIIINHLAPITKQMFNQMPNLEMIAVSRGGPVNIDMKAAQVKKIKVVNTPGRNASAVAEFTIGAILSETRLIRKGHESLRKGIWRGDLYREDITGRELSEMTVGIIGYGNIGKRVVKLLKPFNCKILVCDPYVDLENEDKVSNIEKVKINVLLKNSDVVSLHSRVTDETTNFINYESFKMMKKNSYFINTARGPMVDYGALEDALNENILAGAMLETFSIEPVPSEWSLLKHDNVTLTPHIAGASIKTIKNACDKVSLEIQCHLDGKEPLNPCV